MGALKSQLGGHSDKTTDEGLKKGAMEFQEAAGIFEYIQKELAPQVFGPARSTDISDECLSMAINAMLGQAQSCVFAKAKLVRYCIKNLYVTYACLDHKDALYKHIHIIYESITRALTSI